MEKNAIQTVIDQIGLDSLRKSMGDIALGNCDVHGHYTYDMSAGTDICPLCPQLPNTPVGNGNTATQVEHYINANPIQSLQNPNQKLNPYGV